MMRIGVSGCKFLLVSSYLGSPEQRAIEQLLCSGCCSSAFTT